VENGEIVALPLHGLACQCIDSGKELSVSDLQAFPGFIEEYDTLPDQVCLWWQAQRICFQNKSFGTAYAQFDD